MVQTHDGATTTRSLTYDAFGSVKGGVEPYEVLYAFNGEEYSDTTQLQYLRARYYAPELAAFISKDTELGVRGRINSFNRFAFAEGDPINNFDPTGHAIGNTTYERQMEAAGGINELYNFYVGNSLQASLNRAQAGFNAQLNYAKGVDYTSARAINSIAGISQETANAYILNGALGALSVGLNYGCMPGALVSAAIGTYAKDVNTAKDTTNTQIAIVKDNKVAQYNQYQAYLAWLREQARIAAEEAAADAARSAIRTPPASYPRQQPVSTRTKAANAIDKVKTALSKAANSLADSLAKPIASSKSVSQYSTSTQVDAVNITASTLLDEKYVAATEKYILDDYVQARPRSISVYSWSAKIAEDVARVGSVFKYLILGAKRLPVVGVAAGTAAGIYDNMGNGTTAARTATDAMVDTTFGIAEIGVTAGAAALALSIFPGIGTIAGAAIGSIAGIMFYVLTNLLRDSNGITISDGIKNFTYDSVMNINGNMNYYSY